jgi:hypothetical protein
MKGMSMKMISRAIYSIVLLTSVSYFLANDVVEQIFTTIYKTNEWKLGESVSGLGSEVWVTHRMRRELADLIKQFDITSIADAPCGDLHWMQHVNLGACRYIGIDIVQELIENNIKKFGATKEFRHLNLIDNVIEKVDLILCRDMLAHLTYEQIFIVLKNFKKSGSKYLLVTTGVTTTHNVDMENTGECRRLNLELPPFNFPRPLAIIEEDVPWAFEKGKHLALWLLSDLDV